ncbi:hypothetical protein [Streptomyces sp. NPDC058279]|uniref:hypothetical protein n=1 Tax=Streptomyces sp. NPDC058279 TaxID=3346418 RepID=UPI0036E5D073
MGNPVRSCGDRTLTDDKDGADAVPASAYAVASLRNLDGSGSPAGKWAYVRSGTGPSARTADAAGYDRADDRFEVPGFDASPEAGVIGEAFGDHLAVEVAAHADDVYGRPRRTDLACVADWGSTGYSTAPHCLRRIDGSTVYADRAGEVHADGEIWSRALFDIRGALGARTADRIIVNAWFGFRADTDFADAARTTTISTAQRMYGKTAADAVRAGFATRQIPGIG